MLNGQSSSTSGGGEGTFVLFFCVFFFVVCDVMHYTEHFGQYCFGLDSIEAAGGLRLRSNTVGEKRQATDEQVCVRTATGTSG